MPEFYILLAIFLLSIILTAAFRSYALKNDLIDHPNHRSSHVQPTPRGGGLIFVILFIMALCLLPLFGYLPVVALKMLALPVLIVALLGFTDDVWGLPAKLRFAVQLAAAVIFLYLLRLEFGVYFHGWLFHLGILGSVCILLAMVWSTNLFNFMDGTDGLASIEAITVYGMGGWFLWQHQGKSFALLAWVIVAGVAGFLVWNWPKAKIFMGDVASSFLGFLVIPFALIGFYRFDISLTVWFILYLAFTMDATLTLVRRLLKREKIFEAHKLHAYQRLHQAGYSHQKLLFVMLTLNLFFAVLAWIAFSYPTYRSWVTGVSVICYFLFYVWIERKKSMYDELDITSMRLPL